MNGCHCAGSRDPSAPPSCSPASPNPIAEFVEEGRQALNAHAADRAAAARRKYRITTSESFAAVLDDCLADRAFVRHPTRLVFEFGEMALHQFAQPGPDPRDPEHAVVLYLRPALKDRPDLVALAVAYMIPVINYGDMAGDADCLLHGATLLGLSQEDYYARLCALADFAGAESCTQDVATRLGIF